MLQQTIIGRLWPEMALVSGIHPPADPKLIRIEIRRDGNGTPDALSATTARIGMNPHSIAS